MPLLIILFLVGSEPTQIVRGTVRDAVSEAPVAGATIRLQCNDSVVAGAVSQRNGTYRLPAVPVGYYRLVISMVGYEPLVIDELQVTSGKEVVLPSTLSTSYVTAREVAVIADRSNDDSETNAEFVSVSGHTFRPEETRRYPGSIGDPARMVQNYAGVLGANDARNDIVVRGNSPLGMLYRMEGMNIPNPSHYGALTSAGGVVNMLNNNVLEKSDFLAGAFPAAYGNALSGVFDLRSRRGNDERYEFVGQVSFSGFEGGIEGPMWEGSSFLVNYRYSTLAAFAWMGLDVGVGSAIPIYQDLNFNVSTQLGNGRLTLFGTAGKSEIDFIGDDVDTQRLNAYAEPNRNIRVDYATAWTGMFYEQTFGQDTYLRLLVGGTATNEHYSGDSLDPETRAPYNDEVNDFTTLRWSTTGYLRHRMSSAVVISAGYLVDGTSYDLYSILDKGLATEFTPVDVEGSALLVQAYAQGSWRLTNAVTVNVGVNAMHYTLGDALAIEPRLGATWLLSPMMSVRVGYGTHSQTQNLYVYNVQVTDSIGSVSYPNRALGLTGSQHLVAEWDWFLVEHTRLRIEGYAQWLSDAPVERTPSSYSVMNAGAEFFPDPRADLFNNGTGDNVGVELTLERFLRDGLYYKLTGSIFDSRYAGSDGIERNTAFNSGYIVNVLAGYQFPITTTGALGISLRLNTSGGKYLTPIDTAASAMAGRTVYDQEQAYSQRQTPYFRADVRLSYQMDLAGSTLEIAMDLMNVTNHQNIFIQTYDPRSNSITTQYQQGFIPVPTVRWTF